MQQQVELNGRYTIAQEVLTLPPARGRPSTLSSSTHLTPGDAYGYVLEGVVLVATCEGREIRFQQGETWDEHNQCFALANASALHPARVLMTYIVPAGKALRQTLDQPRPRRLR